MDLVDPILGRPGLELVVIVAEDEGGVVGLLHLLDALEVGVKLLRSLVDGAAGGQLLLIALPGVDGIAGGDEGAVVLRFQDGTFKNPFSSKYVSDGTIKMFTYLVLLHDPTQHALLCVEEPENQLYPQLLLELAEEFRSYADKGGQVFVSTHSPDFLNAMQLDEIYYLEKITDLRQYAKLPRTRW